MVGGKAENLRIVKTSHDGVMLNFLFTARDVRGNNVPRGLLPANAVVTRVRCLTCEMCCSVDGLLWGASQLFFICCGGNFDGSVFVGS